MNIPDTAILNSGQHVGLAMKPYQKEFDDFEALANAHAERAEVVAAIEFQLSQQSTETTGTTTAKEQAREVMAVKTATLSALAVGYAQSKNLLGLKQEFTLTYTDVRYGDAAEDVAHVRQLVAKVQALPAAVRKAFRMSDAVVQAPADAADLFDEAEDTQTEAKDAPRLATLELPVLLRRLMAALLQMKTLLAGVSSDDDPKFRWGAMNTAFLDANKRRKPAAKRHPHDTAPRVVRTLAAAAANGLPVRINRNDYGQDYTLTVENHAATALTLWMGQKDRAKTTPVACPAGAVTVLTRAELGPETARFLMGQFGGDGGGEATVKVRRVVAE